MNHIFREKIKDKKRIVIKIGSSSLTHQDTGALDLIKLEILVRELSDLRNQGKEVVLVSSGAIMVGSQTMGFDRKPEKLAAKQACAAIGQAKLMMIYQKLFAEYNQVASQVLMTKNNMLNDKNRHNARNTFHELLHMGVIPIVNENDTISTSEIEFGDNDRLSAVVAALIGADLLILLSDIDGLFTDDPHTNPDAQFIDVVECLDQHFYDGNESRNDNDIAGDSHGFGNYFSEKRNKDIGAEKHNECRKAHTDSTRNGSCGSKRRTGTENES